MNRHRFLTIGAITAFVLVAASHIAVAATIDWKDCLTQNAAFYQSDDARRIADNVLLYQHDNGGWAKNVDMAAPLGEKARAALLREKPLNDTTIDNHATFTQMEYLARVYQADKGNARSEPYKAAFTRGLDFLLQAQYKNGGWPQYFPLRKGYYTHITFNDGAMVGVLRLLRSIVQNDTLYAFVDNDRRARAATAVQKGLDCILKCQIVVKGKRTAWCAQHDEKTFAPTSARAYEKVSLSGGEEGVGIVRYLMEIEKPSSQVVQAVESAVAWFATAKLTGIRVERKPQTGTLKGFDTVVAPDPTASPTWARFYEVETNRPMFCGRDGVVKYRLAEIEYERRNGYAWYRPAAAVLLEKDYPAWKARLARKTGPAAKEH